MIYCLTLNTYQSKSSNINPNEEAVKLANLEELLWASFDEVASNGAGHKKQEILRTSKALQRLHFNDAAYMCDLTSVLSGLSKIGIDFEEAEKSCKSAFRYEPNLALLALQTYIPLSPHFLSFTSTYLAHSISLLAVQTYIPFIPSFSVLHFI